MSKQDNSVLNAVLHYSEKEDDANSIWVQSIYRGLKFCNFDEANYRISQLLEPSFLTEVSRSVSVSLKKLNEFEYDVGGPASKIRWMLDMLQWATPIQRLNLARCLSATSRYSMARKIIKNISPSDLLKHEQFLFHISKFIIDNRIGDVQTHDAEFEAIKALMEGGVLCDTSLLEAASQVIVWNIKTSSISKSTAVLFAEKGLKVAQALKDSDDTIERLALSSFYRAYAMIPASEQDVEMTRHYMIKSEHFADTANPETPLHYTMAQNAKKTVLESTLKEMLYIAHDIEAADEVSLKLVDLDSNWSINYHERAEVFLKTKNYAKSLQLFIEALRIGLPRISVSQYMIGACQQQLGKIEEAVASFQKTLSLDENNISAGISGHNIAKEKSHPSYEFFKDTLLRWNENGILAQEHKEMIL